MTWDQVREVALSMVTAKAGPLPASWRGNAPKKNLCADIGEQRSQITKQGTVFDIPERC